MLFYTFQRSQKIRVRTKGDRGITTKQRSLNNPPHLHEFAKQLFATHG